MFFLHLQSSFHFREENTVQVSHEATLRGGGRGSASIESLHNGDEVNFNARWIYEDDCGRLEATLCNRMLDHGYHLAEIPGWSYVIKITFAKCARHMRWSFSHLLL